MMKKIAIILAIVVSTTQGLKNRLALTVNCKKTAGVGHFYFDQASPSSPIQLTGEMHGINPGEYHVYIHDKNDTTNRCDSMGPITTKNDGQLFHVFTVNIPEAGPQTFTMAPGPLTLGDIVNQAVAFHWPPSVENGKKTVDPTTLGCGVIIEDSQSSLQGETQDSTTRSTSPRSEIHDPAPSNVDKTIEATPHENALKNRLVLTVNCKKTPGVGTFYFAQSSPSSPIQITGEMHGVHPGEYHVYIHERNDITNRCDSMGPIKRKSDGQLYHVFTVNIPQEGAQTFTVAPGTLTLDEIVDHAVAFHWPPSSENGEKTVDPTTLGCGIIQSSPHSELRNSTTTSASPHSNIQDPTTSSAPPATELPDPTTSSVDQTTKATPLENVSVTSIYGFGLQNSTTISVSSNSNIQDSTTSSDALATEMPDSTTSSVDKTTKAIPLKNVLKSPLVLEINCTKTPGVGTFYFAQSSPSSPIKMIGEMSGVHPGEYYVYIHDKNDITNHCNSMGPISKKSDGELYHVFTVNIAEGGSQTFTMASASLTLDEIVDHAVAIHWAPSFENGKTTVDPTILGCGIIQSPPHSDMQDPTTSSVDKTTKDAPLENVSKSPLVLEINCTKTPGVGTFYFAQSSPSSPIKMIGEMSGVHPGEYYVYIHDENDTTNSCDSMGPISKKGDGELYHVFTVNIAEGGSQTFTMAFASLTLDEIVDRAVAFHWPPSFENGKQTVDPTTLGCGIIKETSESSSQGVVQPSTTSRISPEGEIQGSTRISTSPQSVNETTTALENAYEKEHRLVLTINSKSTSNVGKVYFTQANPTAPIRITGDFEYLPGEYYAYMHDENDFTNHCDSIGSITRNSNGMLYHVFTASIPEDGPRTLTMAPGVLALDDIANRAIGLHWVFVTGQNKITPHPKVITCGIIRKEIEESLRNETQESTTVSQISESRDRINTLISESQVLENLTTISAQNRTGAVPLPDERVMSIPSCPVPLEESKPIDVLVSRQANETCVSKLCYRKLCCKMDATRTITCRPLIGSEC